MCLSGVLSLSALTLGLRLLKVAAPAQRPQGVQEGEERGWVVRGMVPFPPVDSVSLLFPCLPPFPLLHQLLLLLLLHYLFSSLFEPI